MSWPCWINQWNQEYSQNTIANVILKTLSIFHSRNADKHKQMYNKVWTDNMKQVNQLNGDGMLFLSFDFSA